MAYYLTKTLNGIFGCKYVLFKEVEGVLYRWTTTNRWIKYRPLYEGHFYLGQNLLFKIHNLNPSPNHDGMGRFRIIAMGSEELMLFKIKDAMGGCYPVNRDWLTGAFTGKLVTPPNRKLHGAQWALANPHYSIRVNPRDI